MNGTSAALKILNKTTHKTIFTTSTNKAHIRHQNTKIIIRNKQIQSAVITLWTYSTDLIRGYEDAVRYIIISGTNIQ